MPPGDNLENDLRIAQNLFNHLKQTRAWRPCRNPECEPDLVANDGLLPDGLEVSRYSPFAKPGQHGGDLLLMSHQFWAKKFWPKLDAARKKHPELKRIRCRVVLKQLKPQIKSKHTLEQICDALVAEIVQSLKTWSVSQRIHIRRDSDHSFLAYAEGGLVQERRVLRTPALLESTVDRVWVYSSETRDDWKPWGGPDWGGGSSAPRSGAFRKMIQDELKRFSYSTKHTWLAIWCDDPMDVNTNLIAWNDSEHEACVRQAFSEAVVGLDVGSRFREIWLVSQHKNEKAILLWNATDFE